MFDFKKFVRKFTGRTVFADALSPSTAAPMPSPQAAPQPIAPAPVSPASPSTRNPLEVDALARMKQYLIRARGNDLDAEEIEMGMPALWKTKFYHLWEQALREFQSSVAEPQPVNGQQGNVSRVLDREILLGLVENQIRSTRELLPYENLPVIIRDNEQNREMYYEEGARILRQMEDQDASTKSRSVAPVENDVAFKNPFAQVFYQMYLDAGVDNAEQFHKMFQGSAPDPMGGYGNGSRYYDSSSDLSKLDTLFDARVPEGFAGGRSYDPIVEFFISDAGAKHGGAFRRKFREKTGIEEGKIPKAELAKFIASRYMPQAEQKFRELMYVQDPSIAQFVKKKISMKGEGASRNSAMIDSETGGVRDMGEGQNYSALNRAVEHREADKGTVDAFRSSLIEVPSKVHGLSQSLQQAIQSKIDSLKGGAPDASKAKKIQALENKKFLMDAYTSAMQRSLKGIYDKGVAGELSQNELNDLTKQNLTGVKTEDGRFRMVPKSNADDIKSAVDFDRLVEPAKFLKNYATSLVSTLGPERASAILGTEGEPFDLNNFNYEQMRGAQQAKAIAEIGKAKKRLYMKSQFLLEDVGDTVLEMLQQGKVDRPTALAFLKMLKPHGDSKLIGNMVAQQGDAAKAREWVEKQLSTKPQPQRGPDGKIIFDPVNGAPVMSGENSLLNDSIAKGEIPAPPGVISKMPDADFKKWLRSVAKIYSGGMDQSRRRVADYFARILDHGHPEGWTNWDDYNRATKSASAVYHILCGAINKMSSLLSLRHSLAKYASTDHLDEMLTLTREEAVRKINVLWMR